jgi:hypothetical protein
MQTYNIDNGTITKKVIIKNDPKRPNLLICYCFDKNGKKINTLWGKKNQQDIQLYINTGE